MYWIYNQGVNYFDKNHLENILPNKNGEKKWRMY